MENEKDLVITIRERGSEAFYRETVNVLSQYRALLKRPEKKLADNFRTLRIYSILCDILFVLFVLLAIRKGLDGGRLAALILLFFASVLASVYRTNLNRMARKLESHSVSVLTLDTQGVELDHKEVQTVRLAWNNIAFIRVFTESIAVLSKDGAGLVISIDRRYENEVIPWLRENRPDIRMLS